MYEYNVSLVQLVQEDSGNVHDDSDNVQEDSDNVHEDPGPGFVEDELDIVHVDPNLIRKIDEIRQKVRSFDDDMFADSPPVFGSSSKLKRPCVGAKLDLQNAENAIKVGQQFENKEEFQSAMALYALKGLFHFKYPKSDKHRVIARCADPECPWRLYVVYLSNSTILEIRTFSSGHTCTISTKSKYKKGAKCVVIADYLKSKFANGKPGPRACEIPGLVLADLHVTISYMKGWLAREKAMQKARGSDAGSFKLLGTYLYLLKKANPGTVYKLEKTKSKTGDERFKYVFCVGGVHIRFKLHEDSHYYRRDASES